MTSTSSSDPASACYRICVEGHLDAARVDWFEDVRVIQETENQSQLISDTIDQSRLHGLLNQLSALGLTLISVQRQPAPATRQMRS